MPSYYRGIDDDDHIWRIDVENDSRPSKRQRTAVPEMFEKYGIGYNDSINNIKPASFSCSYEEEDMDASSSLESSSVMMTVEDDCEKEYESVEIILQDYIRINNEIEILKEGLDKLIERVGSKNNNVVSKQRHRVELLNSGGHWMITDLLANLTRKDEYSHDARMDVIDDGDDNNINNTVEFDDERVIAVVARSCEILREILLTNPSNTHIETIPNESNASKDATVRYQIYCAGGLDAVISALKRFPTSFDIQLAGCQFISHLVSYKASNGANSKNKDGDTNGKNTRSNTNPTLTLINNLYRSTDRLNIVVRVLGGGVRNHLPSSTSSKKWLLSNTQIWQLYFVVTAIVRSVVRQLPIDSKFRSEIMCTIEKCLIGDGDGSCNSNGNTTTMDKCNVREYDNDDDRYHSRESKGYYSRSYNSSSSAIRHANGIKRHMFEHLMTILIDEEGFAYADVDAAGNSMNE